MVGGQRGGCAVLLLPVRRGSDGEIVGVWSVEEEGDRRELEEAEGERRRCGVLALPVLCDVLGWVIDGLLTKRSAVMRAKVSGRRRDV